MRIQRFEEIEGWKDARILVGAVYKVTRGGTFSRDWGLVDQIRRAAGSAMHNIAEGFDAGSNAEFVRFLRYAQRSCSEVQSQLYVALDQKYISRAKFDDLYTMSATVHKKTGAFIAYLLRCQKTKTDTSKPSK